MAAALGQLPEALAGTEHPDTRPSDTSA